MSELGPGPDLAVVVVVVVAEDGLFTSQTNKPLKRLIKIHIF